MKDPAENPQGLSARCRVFSCMLARGWRYSHTVGERASRDHMYPDPDNPGLMCKDFAIDGITGSSCSNF